MDIREQIKNILNADLAELATDDKTIFDMYNLMQKLKDIFENTSIN